MKASAMDHPQKFLAARCGATRMRRDSFLALMGNRLALKSRDVEGLRVKIVAVLALIVAALVLQSAGAHDGTPVKESVCSLCLYGPDNMVFDGHGAMYLVDTDHTLNSRVLKLTQSGLRLGEWRGFTASADGNAGPEGIAIDPQGRVLVTDRAGHRVVMLNFQAHDLVESVIKDRDFQDLGHLAIDAAGNIFVSEGKLNRIRKYDATGRLLEAWEHARGRGADDWNMPESIAVLADGRLAVEDWGNRRIEVLSATGHAEILFGGPGSAPGAFINSAGLAVDSGANMFVADIGAHRILKFDRTGSLVGMLANSSNKTLFSQGPNAVALDVQGRLYAPDGLSVVQLSSEGEVLARWR